MSSIQSKLVPSSGNGGSPLEQVPEPAPPNPKRDFAFAVKLFGIAGLVVFGIWLLNWAVS